MYKVKFRTDETRNIFFDSMKEKFSNWKSICLELNINKSTLLRYRSGKSLIPHDKFNLISKYIKFKNNKKIILLNQNWGQKIGGNITYKNNKWIFDLGRKKADHNRKIKHSKILDLNLNSVKLAEFMGVLIGDGFLGEYGRTKMIQITGHKINDKKYYEEYLVPLIQSLFDVKINLYKRDTCLRLTIYSKVILNTLTKLFNFPIGKKGDIVIPTNLIKNKKSKIALIRGLFDTDGCVSIDRRNNYPSMFITTTSKNLATQINKILNEFGFNANTYKSKGKNKDAFRVTIFGKEKVLKWKNLISSSNPYHLDRINASVAQII